MIPSPINYVGRLLNSAYIWKYFLLSVHKVYVHTSKWCTCLLRVAPGKWCPITGGQSRHILRTWRCPLVIGSHVMHVTGMNMFIVTASSDRNCRNMSGFWIDALNADVQFKKLDEVDWFDDIMWVNDTYSKSSTCKNQANIKTSVHKKSNKHWWNKKIQ